MATPSSPQQTLQRQRVNRRRGAPACVPCRTRKVRCIDMDGRPCLNCRRDGVQCIEYQSRRVLGSSLRTQHAKAVQGVPPPPRELPQAAGPTLLGSPPTPRQDSLVPEPLLLEAVGELPHFGGDVNSGVGVFWDSADWGCFQVLSDFLGHDTTSTTTASPTLAMLPTPESTAPPPPPPPPDKPTTPGTSTTTPRCCPHGNADTNADAADGSLFCRHLPASVGPHERRYLSAIGALSLATKPAAEAALLRAFALHVHPRTPVLDLDEFLAAVGCCRGHGRGRGAGAVVAGLVVESTSGGGGVDDDDDDDDGDDQSAGRPSSCRATTGRPLSPLLYNAVLYAAVLWVDPSDALVCSGSVGVEAAGESRGSGGGARGSISGGRRAAGDAYFHRARRLYEMGCEPDPLVVVQALVLMTSGASEGNDRQHGSAVANGGASWAAHGRQPADATRDLKDARHWLGIAVSTAVGIGLHRRQPTAVDDDTQNGCRHDYEAARRATSLGKRIWWSCVVRDRLLALDRATPMHISYGSFDVPLPGEHDFFERGAGSDWVFVPVTTQEGRQARARLCISMMELCGLLGDVMRVIDRQKKLQQHGGSGRDGDVVVVHEISAIDMNLASWIDALPTSAQYRVLSPYHAHDAFRAAVMGQRAALHLVYHHAMLALHRYCLSPPRSSSCLTSCCPSSPSSSSLSPYSPSVSSPPLLATRLLRELSRLRIQGATARITALSSSLNQLGQEALMGPEGEAAVLAALAEHAAESQSRVPEMRQLGNDGFLRCMAILRSIGLRRSEYPAGARR